MATAIAGVLTWLASHWRLILALVGLAVGSYVIVVAGQTVGGAIAQTQPVLTQALSITYYAIPMMVYMMVFQMIMTTISTFREVFRK